MVVSDLVGELSFASSSDLASYGHSLHCFDDNCECGYVKELSTDWFINGGFFTNFFFFLFCPTVICFYPTKFFVRNALVGCLLGNWSDRTITDRYHDDASGSYPQ